jgi:hypothetical protein
MNVALPRAVHMFEDQFLITMSCFTHSSEFSYQHTYKHIPYVVDHANTISAW